MEKLYESDKYSVENLQQHSKIYWSPLTTNKERRNIKADLLCQRPGELLLDFRRVESQLKVHDISSHTPSEISIINLRQAITRFYEDIRNCTCDFDQNQLSFFSQQKKINISIKFWDDERKFSARGDDENLIRFLYAYCDCINSLSSNPRYNETEISVLASMDILKPNHPAQDLLEIKCLSLNDSEADNEEPSPINLQEPETSEPLPQPTLDDKNPTPHVISTPTTNPPSIPEIPETPMNSQGNPIAYPTQNRDDILQQILAKVDLIPQIQSTQILMQSTLDTLTKSIKKLDVRLFDAERKIENNTKKIDNFENTLTNLEKQTVKRKDYTSNIEEIRNDYKSLTNEIDVLKTKLATSTSSQMTEQQVKEIAQEIMRTQPSPTVKQPSIPHPYQKFTPSASTDDLDHDILILGDSNTHDIKESWLKHGSTAAKLTAYKIDQAIDVLDQIKVTRQPNKIMVHIGTNHLTSKEHEKNDLEKIKEEYEDLFGLLQRKFPSSQIYLSEIFIRRESSLDNDVKELNKYLETVCTHRTNFNIIRHSDNIVNKNYHLRGNRHLSKSGFYLFLLNIRLIMFRMMPRFRSPHRPSYPNQHHGYQQKPYHPRGGNRRY